jgi:diphthine-ammonia ligase
VLGLQDPPSRVCVGVGGGGGGGGGGGSGRASLPRIGVECLASTAARRVLHVRSISLWAPACIGPYSQASTLHGLLHCAGQIPLLPATMALVSERACQLGGVLWVS